MAEITEDMIERAAAAMYFEDCGDKPSAHMLGSSEYDNQFRAYARVALSAAGVALQEPSENRDAGICPDCAVPWRLIQHDEGCSTPAPSPDREKLAAEARDRADYMTLLSKVTESGPGSVVALAEADRMTRFADALAAPVAVDEAKLAEVLAQAMPGWNVDLSEPDLDGPLRDAAEAYWARVNDQCLAQGRAYARTAVERQAEWLGGGER